MSMDSWRSMIAYAVKENGDNIDELVCTLTEEELDVEFYTGYGTGEGKPFTAWTPKYVYFPVVYDGAEWVGSAPRNPCDIATQHQGGQ